MDVQKAVRNFMVKHGLEIHDKPTVVSQSLGYNRCDYMQSEVDELDTAIGNNDLVEIADGLADLVYFAYGTACVYGINLDPCIEEVHRSNMTKGKLDADGKGGKGEGYERPNLKPIIFSAQE